MLALESGQSVDPHQLIDSIEASTDAIQAARTMPDSTCYRAAAKALAKNPPCSREQHICDRARDTEVADSRERIRGGLQCEDAARVLVDEQKFVAQRCEALAETVDRTVVSGQMTRGEPRCHAERGSHMQRE